METPFEFFVAGCEALNIANSEFLSAGDRDDTKVNQVVLYEYMGVANPDLPIDIPYVQINFFNTNYLKCMRDCYAAFKSLHMKKQWLVEDCLIQQVLATGSPQEMPVERLNGQVIYHRLFNVWFVTTI